jgi:Leucine-rich repeat (LRR) protein
MNRRIVLLIIGSLPTGLTLASAPSLAAQGPPVLQPSELCSDHPDTAIAAFEDGNLESRVRAALAVGEQNDLRCGLLQGLTELVGTGRAGIESLAGIQNLTSLTSLSIGARARLFSGDREITRPLLTDISPLSGLTNLTSLELSRNSISDISALSGLTSLTDLDLGRNTITDISALSGLTSLTYLYLGQNSISDIQPLLDNSGLGAGDSVNLRSTNVSCADVAALQAKGVTVTSDCS